MQFLTVQQQLPLEKKVSRRSVCYSTVHYGLRFTSTLTIVHFTPLDMGDRGHDPLLDSLKVLYELKKNNPNDGETENKFFNAILAYLLGSQADHWWCSKELEPFVRESVMLFSLPAYDHITQYKARMNRQLATCRKCLDAYHKSKPVLRQRYIHLPSSKSQFDLFY